MRVRYKKQEIASVACWVALFLTLLASVTLPRYGIGEDTFGTVFGCALFLIMACFFWTGSQIARAKGYSGAYSLLGLLGPPAQLVVLCVFIFIRHKHAPEPLAREQGMRKCRQRSEMEQIIYCRRNALVGIVFGVCGILAGISMLLFPQGLFSDPENNVVFALGVFLCGYAGVIAGCWWWVKAKHWTDGIVFIGLLPLAVFFIPGVRMFYVYVPPLLPFSMVMMPIILIIVVYALPDKSGWSGRKRWRIRE